MSLTSVASSSPSASSQDCSGRFEHTKTVQVWAVGLLFLLVVGVSAFMEDVLGTDLLLATSFMHFYKPVRACLHINHMYTFMY